MDENQAGRKSGKLVVNGFKQWIVKLAKTEVITETGPYGSMALQDMEIRYRSE